MNPVCILGRPDKLSSTVSVELVDLIVGAREIQESPVEAVSCSVGLWKDLDIFDTPVSYD